MSHPKPAVIQLVDGTEMHVDHADPREGWVYYRVIGDPEARQDRERGYLPARRVDAILRGAEAENRLQEHGVVTP